MHLPALPNIYSLYTVAMLRTLLMKLDINGSKSVQVLTVSFVC